MMTIASSDISEVLSNRNLYIQDHLRNHAHLTNCIHLKNHMHMQKSKVMLDNQFSGESSLMKDLSILQRSRSLRDPSTSPSWNSPIIGSVMKKLEKEGAFKENNFRGIKPLVGKHRKEPRKALTASPLSQSDASRKTASAVGGFSVKDSNEDDRRLRRRKVIGYALADSKIKHRDLKRKERQKGLSGEKGRSDSELQMRPKGNNLNSKTRPLRDECRLEGRMEARTDSSALHRRHTIKDTKDLKDNISVKGRLRHITARSSDVFPSSTIQDNDYFRKDVVHSGEVETGSARHVRIRKVKKSKKYKLKGIERSNFRSPKKTGQNLESSSLSAALNSVGQGGIRVKDFPDSQTNPVQTGHRNSAVTDVPKKGCGIPWNWSRIHDRGKIFLDLAGRSLSCGLSDSAARKIEGLASQTHSSSHREFPAALETSDYSTSSLDSDSESLPLLTELGGSQESADTDAQGAFLSGELDLYADHQISVKQNSVMDSETLLTGKIEQGQNIKVSVFSKHKVTRILSEKYVPKTFRELVGQNLVTQVLMNAIVRGKIAPVYVFHGPHGTGKTSCARIFAAAMNCHSLEGSRPCGLCRSCLAQSLGKNSDVKEISGVGAPGICCFQSALDNVVMYPPSSRYGVCIVDDCDILTNDDWNAFLKVLDEVPWNVVFILIASKLDQIPHSILSRCQKFLFPKLKEVDIMNKLQMIASQEDLEIDSEALTLIASKANGSMRDAEMTLDQLSLLGQRISLSLVQELIGLIPDEKLVDLLDLALSADTVNTVKSLRDLMETGVEPLALMSQLAALITDILAGSYKLHKERRKKMFLHKQTLSKEEMNRLRQALRTLSEAEKQLLLSNDRTTWLTAALLQLAPDPSHTFLSSSSGTSFIQSPTTIAREEDKLDEQATGVIRSNLDKHSKPMEYAKGSSMLATGTSGKRERISGKTSRESNLGSLVGGKANIQSLRVARGTKSMPSAEDSMDPLTTDNADKMESHDKEQKTRQEKFVSSFSQASQSAHSSQIGVTTNCLTSKKGNIPVEASLPVDQSIISNTIHKVAFETNQSRLEVHATTIDAENSGVNEVQNELGSIEQGILLSHDEASTSGIVGPEFVCSSTHRCTSSQDIIPKAHPDEECLESAWVQETPSSPNKTMTGHSFSDTHINLREQPPSQSLLKSKSTRDCCIEQPQRSIDACDQNFQHSNISGSSEQNSAGHRGTDILTFISQEGITIAEKIEEENLRLESRSRGFLCWKERKVNRGKSMHFKSHTRRPKFFQKLVPCGKPCL